MWRIAVCPGNLQIVAPGISLAVGIQKRQPRSIGGDCGIDGEPVQHNSRLQFIRRIQNSIRVTTQIETENLAAVALDRVGARRSLAFAFAADGGELDLILAYADCMQSDELELGHSCGLPARTDDMEVVSPVSRDFAVTNHGIA